MLNRCVYVYVVRLCVRLVSHLAPAMTLSSLDEPCTFYVYTVQRRVSIVLSLARLENATNFIAFIEGPRFVGSRYAIDLKSRVLIAKARYRVHKNAIRIFRIWFN